MKVVCYYRHSTDNAMQDANSIPKQRRACREFATRNDWEILEEIEDKGESGAGDKKNLMDLMERTIEGEISFDAVLVRDMTRLTRKNVFKCFEDMEWMVEPGVKIATVKSNDTKPRTVEDLARDPAVIMNLWSSAETVYEAGDQAVEGLLSAHKDGRLSWVGPTPFGMDKVEGERPPGAKSNGKPFKVLKANEDIEIVRLMFDSFLAGCSVRSLVSLLEKSNRYKDRNANSTAVKHILKNPIYCGLWAFGMRNVGKNSVCMPNQKRNNYSGFALEDSASVIEYDVEKAVSKETFLEAQKILKSNQHKSRGAPAKKDYRYSGFMKCSHCGGAIVAQSRRYKGEQRLDYVCAASAQSGRKCREGEKPFRKQFNQPEMDELIQRFFADVVSFNSSFHWQLIEAIANDIKENSDSSKAGLREEMAVLEVDELEIKKTFEKLGEFPDWLVDKQQDISRRKKEIRELMNAKASLSSLTKNKRDQWIAGRSGGEGARYCSLVWDLAFDYARNGSEWSENDKLDKVREMISTWFMEADQYMISTPEDNPDEINGFAFADVEDIISVLREMGMNTIDVRWIKDIKRGRPGWCLESINVTFFWSDSVADMECTLKAAFHIRDQSSNITFDTPQKIGA